MRIPDGAIIPLFSVSFILLAFQYFRVNPERRVRDVRFGLMVGAVALIFVTVGMEELPLSPIFFALALFWLGLALYLLRLMPPPRH